MPRSGSRRVARQGGTHITEVSEERVRASLASFRKRLESSREKEALYYSCPSDKTRVRVLE